MHSDTIRLGGDCVAKILIVEDEEAIRLVLSMHLSLVSYDVYQAGEANRARQLLEQKSVDLAILDVMLPGQDGFSLAETFIGRESRCSF